MSPGSRPELGLDLQSADALWADAADAIDMATLSAVVMDDRDAQPLIPAIVAGLALKALVGVFCSGLFVGLGLGKLGERAGRQARGILSRLRANRASEVDAARVTREVEAWVAQARRETVTEDARTRAENALTELLVERGEDPAHARAAASALARAVVGA